MTTFTCDGWRSPLRNAARDGIDIGWFAWSSSAWAFEVQGNRTDPLVERTYDYVSTTDARMAPARIDADEVAGPGDDGGPV